MNKSNYATYPSLRDRVVLVSGGAEGIGASIVEAFARQGSRVCFLDVSDTPGRELEARLNREGETNSGGNVSYYHCDLTDLSELAATAERVLQEYSKVDVLINNAARDIRKTTADVTPEFWDAQIAVNLRHFFFMTQHIVPAMKEARKGVIINVGSITWAIPATGLPCYTTCKAGVMGLTRTHAHEFGRFGIRVNSIMPGGIATPRQEREIYTPEYEEWIMNHQALKIVLRPEDVARLALFLAADDSAGITNQSYTVDAGWGG